MDNSKKLVDLIYTTIDNDKKAFATIKIASCLEEVNRVCAFKIDDPYHDIAATMKLDTNISEIDLLIEQILNALLSEFLNDADMQISKAFVMKSAIGDDVNAIAIRNNIGSEVYIDFAERGPNFGKQIRTFNAAIDENSKKLKKGIEKK